ncbi:hypothetical protein F511_43545 [Dorcoceras hygrometricum]|uniref:Uncharacterized protein n=1 Tax=Dorcoceras hygrometricum TaxID=472368 RepID=A0A2Z7AR74_9LAMI|nr:hypothetical protein F511_43545 [Dorcoceras hygrometricum]
MESKFRLESPPHTAAPHRAHERARYMRAGRAWMGAAPRYHREMVRRCWPGRTRCLALLVTRDTTSGRALATKLAPLPQAMAALNRALAARFLFAGRRLCSVRGRAMEALVDVARRCVSRDGARAAAAFFVVAAPPSPAAAPPPLRRVSCDVVTAGLNSSRVWFGPVPGSP